MSALKKNFVSAGVPSGKVRARHIGQGAYSVFRIIILLAIGFVILYPLLYIVSTSLRSRASFMNSVRVWLPEKLDALIESMRRNTVNFMGASKSEIRKVQDEATVTADDGVLKFSLIGLAAGLVLGVGAAFLLYFADNTVKDADELKAITGAELLAKVDTKN